MSLKGTNNAVEKAFVEKMKADGWEVYRSGYPDFVCLKGKESILVEVKHNATDEVKPHQIEMLKILSGRYFMSYIWSPDVDGLTPIDANVNLYRGQRPHKPKVKHNTRNGRTIIKQMGFRCERCGHEWITKQKGFIPTMCPKCKSLLWDIKKG